MSKRTPGPWKISSGGLMIFVEKGPLSTVYTSATGLDEALENNRLMAAAPELFDALSDLVVGIEMAAENGIDLTGYVGLSAAFAAIRKAKGETT